MKEKIQSIKLNGMLCIIFIAITYLVTLNIENGIFQPNLWWMSNNFALTVSGGIATGFVAGLTQYKSIETVKAKPKQSCFLRWGGYIALLAIWTETL